MANKGKVLVVEDEIAIASLYEMILSKLGYQFIEPVTTGEESIETVKKNRPDIIIMDICLAGKIDGIEAAKEIIRIDKGIKILFITGYGDEATQKRIRKLGDYIMLSKPVSIVKLTQVMESMLSGKQRGQVE